jgi:hypothetical protein
MCSIITEKDVNPDMLNMFKKILKKSSINPKFMINEINVNNKKINIVQENYLIAGTKGRVVQLLLKHILKKNPNVKTLTYRGTFNGFGALATAYCAYKEGLKCEVFLSKMATNSKPRMLNKQELYNSRQIITLVGLNAKIHLCPDYGAARNLQYSITTREIKNKPNLWELIDGYYNIDMGLLDKEGIMPKLLSKQLIKASKNTILEDLSKKEDKSDNSDKKNNNTSTITKKPTFWLVAGTSGIAQSLVKAFPNSNIKILLVGGGKYLETSMKWLKNQKNVVILSKELNKEELRTNRAKYYKSTSGYDDRIWPYVKEYAKDGDFVWNVGADEFEI